jgi:hypothetical protein
MRVNDLGSAKKLALACVLVLAILAWFGREKEMAPVEIAGVVSGVQESDGALRAFAVESAGQRYVVRVTALYLQTAAPPSLAANQEVVLTATSFKAVKQGVTCDLVKLVRAGPVRDGSAPQGNETLPVDDLKTLPGFKGM